MSSIEISNLKISYLTETGIVGLLIWELLGIGRKKTIKKQVEHQLIWLHRYSLSKTIHSVWTILQLESLLMNY